MAEDTATITAAEPTSLLDASPAKAEGDVALQPGSLIDTKPDATVEGKTDTPPTSPEKTPPADALPKPTEAKPVVAPEKYADPKLPENMVLNPEVRTEFDALAKSLNLPQETYQKIIDLQVKAHQAETKAAMDMFTKTKTDWAEQTNKELGVNSKPTLALAAKAIDRAFQDPAAKKEFLEMMSEARSGLGNWSPMVKLLSFFGKTISEDTLVNGKPANRAEKTFAEVVFDHPTSKTT